jgi:hypothetical protein
MMVPTVHLNGTSKDELVRQVADAGRALRLGIETLGEANPNGRDFYIQGPDALRLAQQEHRIRLGKLEEVHDELQTLAEAIFAA